MRTVRAAQRAARGDRQLDLERSASCRRSRPAVRHPALSLTELAEKCRPPITKAAAHHRMAVLRELAGAGTLPARSGELEAGQG